MPCALVSKARPFANVESAILPFLAPRTFIDSAPRVSYSDCDGRARTASQKDKEEENADRELYKPHRTTRRMGSEPRYASPSPRSHFMAYCRTASPLHSEASAHFRGDLIRSSTSTSWRMRDRYAGIYSYARAHCAAYSTKESPSASLGTGRTTQGRRARIVRKVSSRKSRSTTAKTVTNKVLRLVLEDAAEQHTERPNGSRVRPDQTKPPTVKKLIDYRRQRAFDRERRRLESFVSNLPHTDRVWLLFRRGLYRSLCRRVFGLGRARTTRLLLTQGSTKLSASFVIRALAALDYRVYGRWRRVRYPIIRRHDPNTRKLALDISQGIHNDDGQTQSVDLERMSTNWMAVSESARKDGWHLVLFFFLDRKPTLALPFIQVLAAVSAATPLQSIFFADALEHIAGLHLHHKSKGLENADMNTFVPTFAKVFLCHLASFKGICSQSLLLNLAKLSTHDDLRHLFDLLMDHNAYIRFDTLLHYASIFSDHGNYEYALRCLRNAIDSITRPTVARHTANLKRFLWSCALVLRKSAKEGQNYHATNEILADFLKLGVKLDILLHNVVISNAVGAGDYATAFRVYYILKENGIEPDKYTYSVLLHGCATSNDPGAFQEFAELCREKAIELKAPWLADQYLYYLYTLHPKDDPAHLSDILLQSYSQFYSTSPVAPLCSYLSRSSLVPIAASDDQQNNDGGLMEASTMAMYIILELQIRKALAISDAHVWNLYSYFRRLVTEDYHPALSRLAQSPRIWNAFLLAFCKTQQFANASSLIKYMTDGLDPRVPQPDVISWNIFMQGFFRNRKTRAAERIYEIMRARGIEPSRWTYTIMLQGYAQAQHHKKVAETFSSMEHDQQLEPWLLQALTKMHDMKRLMFMLENDRVAKEEQRKKEEEARKAIEKERWEMPKFTSLLSRLHSSAFVERSRTVRQAKTKDAVQATQRKGSSE